MGSKQKKNNYFQINIVWKAMKRLIKEGFAANLDLARSISNVYHEFVKYCVSLITEWHLRLHLGGLIMEIQ